MVFSTWLEMFVNGVLIKSIVAVTSFWVVVGMIRFTHSTMHLLNHRLTDLRRMVFEGEELAIYPLCDNTFMLIVRQTGDTEPLPLGGIEGFAYSLLGSSDVEYAVKEGDLEQIQRHIAPLVEYVDYYLTDYIKGQMEERRSVKKMQEQVESQFSHILGELLGINAALGVVDMRSKDWIMLHCDDPDLKKKMLNFSGVSQEWLFGLDERTIEESSFLLREGLLVTAGCNHRWGAVLFADNKHEAKQIVELSNLQKKVLEILDQLRIT